MAKVNQVEYDYKKNHFNSHKQMIKSISTISDTTNNSGAKLLENISAYQGDANDPCGAVHFAKTDSVIVLPCSNKSTKQIGVLEIKTAWRPLLATDNAKEFLVREAIVFDEIDSLTFNFRANKVKYALIGMHIMHKTNNHRNFFIAT